MKKNLKRFAKTLFLAFILWIILCLSKAHPNFIQEYYTQGFYTYYSTLSYELTKWFTFSLGDILYICIALYAIQFCYKLVQSKHTLFNKIITLLVASLYSITYIFALFIITWGLNNYNTPLETKLNYSKDYSNEDLLEVSYKILKQTQRQHKLLSTHKDTKVKNPYSVEQILHQVPRGMQKAALELKVFTYRKTTIKESLFSPLITYMGFSGYINPFTNEAQINNQIPKLTMIVTASHETAHQLGFSRESEANFIGYIASKNQELEINRYAANIFALRYCLRELNKKEPVMFQAILQEIPKGIQDNLRENALFWHSHRNFTDSFFNIFYDNFLKATNQKQGLQSYNKFVDFLIQFYKDNPL